MKIEKISSLTAGLFYLVFILLSVVVKNINDRFASVDISSISSNILASEKLYRLGFVLDILSAVFFFLAAWGLYVLLQPVNKNLAVLFMLVNLVGVGVQVLSDLFLFAPLVLLHNATFLKAFQANQIQVLITFFLDLKKTGFMIAQVFFSAWLLPLGYLVYKSGSFPKFFGVMVLADFVCWSANFFQSFLFPDFTVINYPCYAVGFLAEFGLTLWLLITGLKP